jgi:hypothetical protein
LSEDFQLIGDRREAESHLNEGIRAHAPATVWTKNQEFRFEGNLFPLLRQGIADPAHFQLSLPPGYDSAPLVESAKKNKDPQLFLNVALTRANIFFKTIYAEYKPDLFILRNPDKIFKVQRRKDMRFRIRDGYIVKVDFKDPTNSSATMTHKMFDISAGGCSFIVEADDLPIFVEKLVLRRFSFTLSGRKIEVDVEIKNNRPNNKAGYHNVGVAFINMRAAEAQHIAKYVFDENLKYLSKFL